MTEKTNQQTTTGDTETPEQREARELEVIETHVRAACAATLMAASVFGAQKALNVVLSDAAPGNPMTLTARETYDDLRAGRNADDIRTRAEKNVRELRAKRDLSALLNSKPVGNA